MRFRHELTYPAGVEAVREMLDDRDFREEVCRHQQVLRYSVSIEETAGGLEVWVDQVQAARGLPSAARRLVGDEIEIEQRETWHTLTEAGLQVRLPGKPARMSGAISLRGAGAETVETVTGEINVSIPLVGGAIEEVVGRIFGYALDAEHTVGRRWLTEGA